LRSAGRWLWVDRSPCPLSRGRERGLEDVGRRRCIMTWGQALLWILVSLAVAAVIAGATVLVARRLGRRPAARQQARPPDVQLGPPRRLDVDLQATFGGPPLRRGPPLVLPGRQDPFWSEKGWQRNGTGYSGYYRADGHRWAQRSRLHRLLPRGRPSLARTGPGTLSRRLRGLHLAPAAGRAAAQHIARALLPGHRGRWALQSSFPYHARLPRSRHRRGRGGVGGGAGDAMNRRTPNPRFVVRRFIAVFAPE
jgi:hypothetical protein